MIPATVIIAFAVMVAYAMLYVRSDKLGKKRDGLVTFIGVAYTLEIAAGIVHLVAPHWWPEDLKNMGNSIFIFGMAFAISYKVILGNKDASDKLAIRLAVASSIMLTAASWQVNGAHGWLEITTNVITMIASCLTLIRLGRLLWQERQVTPVTN